MRAVRQALGVLSAGLVAMLPAPLTPPSPAGFVAADGPRLQIDGQPWTPLGYNQYRLTSIPGGFVCDAGYGAIDDAQLAERLDAMKAAGANVVRTWFFQSQLEGGGWEPFDRLLAAAATRGMSVIPTLVNHYGDCEPWPTDKDAAFYAGGYRAPGYGYARSYRDYARAVAARYADEPAVAFWQLVNEAELPDTLAAPCPADAAAVLRAFAADMRATIRAVDANHLVSLGTIGSGQCGASYLEYEHVHEVVDLCELHDYGFAHEPLPGDEFNGVQRRAQQCASLGKPLLVGEVAIRADVGSDGLPDDGGVSATTLQRRARFFAAKFAAQRAIGVDGHLIWEGIREPSASAYNLAGDRYGVGLPAAAGDVDPVAAVMRDAGPRPSPRIVAGPSATTSDPTPKFTFTSADAGARFECRLDRAAFAACGSPYTTPPLADGEYLFEVRTASGPLPADPTPARRRFSVAAGPRTPPSLLPSPSPLPPPPPPAPPPVAAPPPPPGPAPSTPPAPVAAGCASPGAGVVGSDADDVLRGDAGADVLFGGAGDDRLLGFGGRDCLYGQLGADELDGGPGDDLLRGGAGHDDLVGGSGDDVLAGAGGADRLRGGTGADRLGGGDGDDALAGDAGADRLDGGAGADRLDGGAGADRLDGGAGADRLDGSAGRDRLSGGAGADRLAGGSGDDRLIDAAGRDAFDGGAGDDHVDARDPAPLARRDRDTVRCGPGSADVALVDRFDRVARDCERVRVSTRAAAGPAG